MMPAIGTELPKQIRDIRKNTNRSYLCPKCDGTTAVVDSRPIENGGVRRRRLCVDCRHRFTTYELEGDAHASLVEQCAGMIAKCEMLANIARDLGDELAALQVASQALRDAK